MNPLHEMWHEQADFDRQLRSPPTSYPERTALTKEMVLHLMSECDELLRAAGAWKTHRNQEVLENKSQVRIELIDIWKYWIIVAQAWEFTPEELEAEFWRKSMVVRQRYSEEWVRSLTGDLVIVDIDNVLCDYILGLTNWLEEACVISRERAKDLREKRPILTADAVGLSHLLWKSVKHKFRSEGHKAFLPAMPDASRFTQSLVQAGYTVVLITSRPIDRYPNIYNDTLQWLAKEHIAFHFVWWAEDKATLALDRNIMANVRYVVDDDLRFVQQFAPYVRTYWLRAPSVLVGEIALHPNITQVRTFEELLTIERTRTVTEGVSHGRVC